MNLSNNRSINKTLSCFLDSFKSSLDAFCEALLPCIGAPSEYFLNCEETKVFCCPPPNLVCLISYFFQAYLWGGHQKEGSMLYFGLLQQKK
ncbi:hypothetical protein OVS_01930 [Mycoplasma ovis str. Michigan]|uniref:Uncharacterized protein n=1 Tax=Mycoplasma ovis str. Michigan TaxID=1415773 RepID=A0ABN4BN38_9MOLU|nr:hypothetical protein OVS_01930 [Mycoplasma ovis str. Michigan]